MATIKTERVQIDTHNNLIQTRPPTSGGGPGLLYAQQLTQLANIKRIEYPRVNFLLDPEEEISP